MPWIQTCILIVFAQGFSAADAQPPTFDIVPLGPTDVEHTRNDGYRNSYILGYGEGGEVAGGANRYNGGASYLGQTTWLYNGAGTINIGLTDVEHTRNDGYRASLPTTQLNASGQVAGFAYRFNGGSSDLGLSAWLFNGASTINIGPIDVEHTRSDGYRRSITTTQLNELGQVAGRAERYNGGATFLGQSAWLYNGTSTINIGLSDAEHTRNDGYQLSATLTQVNEAGQVAGYSRRYNGGAFDLGTSIWIYNGASTINIGLSDAEHTRNDG
ncbi:MAG: hypothetical protein KDA71_23800, partial [Planctomycetales bacterium]|nr:hypothetical protein [Planctomycetales bacterium]